MAHRRGQWQTRLLYHQTIKTARCPACSIRNELRHVVAEDEQVRSDATNSKTAVVKKSGMMAKKTVRSTALRACLPAVRKDFFFPFTQHLPLSAASAPRGRTGLSCGRA